MVTGIRSTYFFSPSYSKNDSNVGGAFILALRSLGLLKTEENCTRFLKDF